ncbi:MAG: hypothetical protein ACHQQ3_01025 [Gemmatimonadales bacterium]
MTTQPNKLLLWSPRVLGVLVCAWLAVFSLDAFGGNKSFVQALPDFAMHVAPMVVLLAVVAISWRWEWVGGLVFTCLAAGYAYFARNHLSWIPVIAGPLLIVGVLFCLSWLHHRQFRTTM